jgi:hypothetical protein
MIGNMIKVQKFEKDIKDQDAATDGKDLRCLNAMGKVRAETASRLTLR